MKYIITQEQASTLQQVALEAPGKYSMHILKILESLQKLEEADEKAEVKDKK